MFSEPSCKWRKRSHLSPDLRLMKGEHVWPVLLTVQIQLANRSSSWCKTHNALGLIKGDRARTETQVRYNQKVMLAGTTWQILWFPGVTCLCVPGRIMEFTALPNFGHTLTPPQGSLVGDSFSLHVLFVNQSLLVLIGVSFFQIILKMRENI